MGFHHLDEFARVDSPLTRRSPAVRLVGAATVALGAAFLPFGAWPQLVALGLLVLGLGALARIRPRAFVARFAPPFILVVLASAALLVLAPGETVARVGPLRLTDGGVLRFGSVAGRAAIAIGASVVLVCTTSFPDILRGLRALRLPEAVTTPLALAYRYLYVLTDEIGRLRRAARSRNAATGSASRRRLLVPVAAAAIERSLTRSERVHQAMLSRGFTGRMPSLDTPRPYDRGALEVSGLAVLVALVLASTAL